MPFGKTLSCPGVTGFPFLAFGKRKEYKMFAYHFICASDILPFAFEYCLLMHNLIVCIKTRTRKPLVHDLLEVV